MKAESFQKEFQDLKKKFSFPNHVALWFESILRSHFRLEEKIESLETLIKILKAEK